MAMYLRQSTASQEVLLGPFVDSTDGNTAETGLTIANTDIKVWKTGATTLADKNSGGATHISNGNYYAVLDATDTDTLGPLEVVVQVAGALAVRREFQVLPGWQYDSLFTANGPAPALGLIDIGTAQSATSTTLVLRSGITVTDDVIIGATIFVYSSTNGLMERRVITDWVSSTDTATVDAWTQTPTGTILYAVYATPPSPTGLVPAVNVTQFGGTNGTFASGRPEVNTTHAAGTAWGSGAITAASIATGAIDADALATDAATEITGAVLNATASSYNTAGTIGAAINNAGSVNAATVADAVWEEAVADHSGTAGSVAERLSRVPNAAAGGSGGLPTADANNAVRVQSGTGTGQLSFTSGVLSVNVTQFGGTNGTFASGVPSVNAAQISGDATAADNLEAALDGTGGVTITAALSGNITGNITGNLSGSVGSVTGNVGGNVTGNLGGTLTSTERNAIADALLNRDFSSVSDTNARTMLNALRFLRNKWSVSGGTLTVTKENDTTSAWTAAVTGTAGADPITSSDPA